MVVEGSGERVSSCFIMSHTCSIGEKSGDLPGQGSCCTPWKAHCITAAIYGCALSCRKSTSSSCQRNGRSTELTTCAMYTHCLLYPAETPHVTASCDWWHPTPWSLRWGLCVMSECTPEDDAHQVYAIHMYVHYLHTDRTYSHHWRQESNIPISS